MIRRALLFTALAFIIIGFISWHFEKNLFYITSVEITPIDVNASSDILFQKIKQHLEPKTKKWVGSYFWNVDLDETLKSLVADKRVKDAQITRELLGPVKIKITPHEPALNLFTSSSQLIPVARDGSLLNRLSSYEAPNLPILRGDKFLHDVELRTQALQLVLEMPETGTFSQATLSEIKYDKKQGFSVILTKNGAEIRVGFDSVKPKVSQIEKVMTYLENQNLQGRVIDARFSKKIVVRLRNAP